MIKKIQEFFVSAECGHFFRTRYAYINAASHPTAAPNWVQSPEIVYNFTMSTILITEPTITRICSLFSKRAVTCIDTPLFVALFFILLSVLLFLFFLVYSGVNT